MSYRILFALLLLFAFPLCAAPADAARAARVYRTAHEQEILAELVELLKIPNVASDTANIGRNADAIVAMCVKRGIAARQLRIEGAPPLVVAEVKAPKAKQTIAFYAHYDGQPVDATQWTVTQPWQPLVKDGFVYARGASDDKAPILGFLVALDALRAAKIAPSVNLKFVFEGEAADAWVLCDGPVHQSRRMQLFFGARGVTDAELTVYGPLRALHSGHYGNWAPNPIVTLTHLMDSMRDTDGRILIDGFYDDITPLTPAEREALAAIPDIDASLRRELALGRTEGSGKPLNEQILLPALNVRGIASGRVGEGASNTINTEARASIDFRLVPAQTPASVRAKVEAHL
ncbi:MAG: M20/M25/M40 family metallo-hydrolase, partial [Acidobacteria bacterium]|nr:M20/M25/M40 family metallo-hydrolase [Acidobacteriota bacterium]